MTKVSSLACTATAMLLTFGVAMADEVPEIEQATPAATTTTTTNSENQPKSEEATTDTHPSQDAPAKTSEEPACN
jgi:hypothetical protein